MYWQEKKIWITGASSGIGEALALALAQKNVRELILSARKLPELEQVKAQCLTINPALSVRIVPLDIEKFDTVFETIAAELPKIGKLDILINNAGLSQRSLASETHFSVDKRIIDVNLLGTIAVTKAILPQFLAQKSGNIVVISSLMGKFGAPLRSAYAAAKHGLHGFFDTLRAECFKDNIQVLIVCPGFVQTNVSRNALTADGSPQGSMDDATNNGLTTENTAAKILKALENKKEEIYIGGSEVRGVYLKRFFPLLLSKIVRKAKTT
jgi:dehydrogenase/reductase SDR family member 7B